MQRCLKCPNVCFSCCVKGSNPQVGDKVLVEAMYNASMPFKWNATRLQVLPMDRSESMGGRGSRFTSAPYNNVPPPCKFLTFQWAHPHTTLFVNKSCNFLGVHNHCWRCILGCNMGAKILNLSPQREKGSCLHKAKLRGLPKLI